MYGVCVYGEGECECEGEGEGLNVVKRSIRFRYRSVSYRLIEKRYFQKIEVKIWQKEKDIPPTGTSSLQNQIKQPTNLREKQ